MKLDPNSTHIYCYINTVYVLYIEIFKIIKLLTDIIILYCRAIYYYYNWT